MSLQSLLVIIKVCHKITLDHRMYMVVVSTQNNYYYLTGYVHVCVHHMDYIIADVMVI